MAKNSQPKSEKSKKAPVSLQEVQEQIEVRAYQIYETRVRQNHNGSELTDWMQAEKEVKTKLNIC